MAEEQKPPGWWHTIPGLLTAMAGFISAVAALILALKQAEVLGKGGEPTTKVPPEKTAEPPAATGQVAAPPSGRSPAPALDETSLKALARARWLIPQQGPSQGAAIFADVLRGKAYYTIVVRDNCDSTTVRNAIFTVPNPELIVLPLPGTECYRVGWGLYENEADAGAARHSIGDRLRQLDSVIDGRVESVAATLQGQDTER